MTKQIMWTKKLSMGIKDIDDQHKYFIGLINKAFDIEKRNDKEGMGKELNALVEYARIHFSTEEAYFDNWKYPFKREHIIEHEKILINILKYKDEFDAGKRDYKEILKFLIEWLENHLKKYDMKYSKYFRENGFIK
jgi:hemerythrin-like metal-binding protein